MKQKQGLRERMSYHKYTPEERRFIEDNISGRSYAELVYLFNRKFNCSISNGQIKNFLAHNNMRNKWNNRLSDMRFFAYAYRPIGSEFIDSYGYIRTKVANPDVWRRKHIVIWEAAHGPLPKGHAIIFADGNKANLALDNLLMVSRRELMIMNRKNLICPDADLTRSGKAIADIYLLAADRKREIKKRSKSAQ
jgi:hypothetical protein